MVIKSHGNPKGSWNAASDEMEKANACAKLMINEAIDAEILAEVKERS